MTFCCAGGLFKDLKYGYYSYYYSIAMDERSLRLSFKVRPLLFRDFNRLNIVFTLLENGKNREITYKNITIFKEADIVKAQLSQINITTNLIEILNEKELKYFLNSKQELILEVDYSFEELLIDLKNSNGVICYNVGLNEEVLPTYMQLIGTKFPQMHLGVAGLER